MKKMTDLGRSVHSRKSVLASLSLLLACAAMGAGFLVPAQVRAEDAEPLKAVSVMRAVEPLKAVPVVPDYKKPDSYFNDFFGFSRTDLVSYLAEHADEYLGTPYAEATKQPVLGLDGHMQCEGFLWSVMSAIAKENTTDVPCGNIYTEPANGGGWVNWSYYHHVDPIEFYSKEEMLASGVLEKGDVIWSFDISGPYGLSNSNHVGFFWGDSPKDDKFWESAVKTKTEFYAGSADGNRIAQIESMSAYPSVWWVFKMSPDEDYDPAYWAGLPAAGIIDPEDAEPSADKETEKEEPDGTETGEPENTDDAEEVEVKTVSVPKTIRVSADREIVSSSSQSGSDGQSPEQAERVKPAEEAKPAEITKPTENTNPAEYTGPAENMMPAESAEPAEESGSAVQEKPHEVVFFTGAEEDKGYYFQEDSTETEYGYGY